MTTARGYVAGNDRERARLVALVARCTDADLAHPMPGGWTVAGVLAHAAFWDQRILVLVEQWEKGIAPREELPADVTWINDSVKPLLLALPPRKAAEIAVAIAEAVDARVAALSADIIAKNEATPLLNWSRADHRGEHLDEIEHALGLR
ncbi:MAG TPA: DinB family protein [Candidatus Limnocylindria bacterium]|nr:DinB family protein [Candidatus Limnocylindria bacterium]